MSKQWIGCATSNFRAGRPAGFSPQAVVIHIMDGTLTGTDAWFNNPASEVSAHYGVGKNGDVHQYVQEADTAFHAGNVFAPTWPGIRKSGAGQFINPNLYTIGIEHEGHATDPWGDPQYQASAELLAEIAGRWGIPLDRSCVVKHHEIRASKECPGNVADLDKLIALAGGQPAFLAPETETVRTLTNMNLRREAPKLSSPVLRVVPANSTLEVAAFTKTGDVVNGSGVWYRDPEGNFFWAGATAVPEPIAKGALMPCKLRVNNIGDWIGPTGDIVKLKVAPDQGQLKIVLATYDGQTLPTNPVTFTIKQGRKTLRLTLEDSLPNDTIVIKEDCANAPELDRFPFDPGNPVQGETVVGEAPAPTTPATGGGA